MAKTYVTFGQDHIHQVQGVVYDKDCVAVIECEDAREGREKAFEYFGRHFCFEYFEGTFPLESMHYYTRGLIPVGGKEDAS